MKLLNLEPATRLLAWISVTAGILIVTLFPAHGGIFQVRRWAPSFSGAVFLANMHCSGLMDVSQNILLFLPFGFLTATFIPGRDREFRRQALTCLAGVCLSASVEILQAWIPGRFPSLVDVVLNGAGALCGGLLAAHVSRIVSAPFP